MNQISKSKLKKYLDWLAENQEENMTYKSEIGNDAGYAANKECARVARMLIGMIDDGKFDEERAETESANQISIKNDAFRRMETLFIDMRNGIKRFTESYKDAEDRGDEEMMFKLANEIDSSRNGVSEIYFVVTGIHSNYNTIMNELKIEVE